MMPMDSRTKRYRRHVRVRAKVEGTSTRPRLAVFRSLRHISAQCIDDSSGKTIVAASDRDVNKKGTATLVSAKAAGVLVAQRAKAAGITTVVFDRGGHAYHGQVKALAEGAREEGLIF